VALVTLVAGGALAACGSASSSSNTTTSTTASASASGSGSASGSAAGGGANSARRAELVSCLKAHGVTLPSRPAGGGAPPGGAPGGSGSGTGTGTTGTGTGTTPRRGFFFGGGGARNISPKMQAAFKACGARFGFRGGAGGGFGGRISHTAITNFVTCVKQHGYNLPAPNFSGKGPIFPRNIETNAKFQAAAKSCQHLLIPPRPSGGSGTGTSTTSGA
jgi:hypothetical protein